MTKSANEVIATWPEWKRELAGHKESKNMTKALSESILEQFRAAMIDRGMNQTDVAIKSGVSQASVSFLMNGTRNLTLKTIERLATAIGGTVEIKFIRSKTEIELLREENERLKKQLSAKRYVENGTLNKK